MLPSKDEVVPTSQVTRLTSQFPIACRDFTASLRVVRRASTGYTSTVTTYTGSLTTTTRHAGGSSGGRRCRSASVALSCGTPETASRATTSTSADKGGHGDALPEPRWPLQTHRGIQGGGDGPVEQESRGNLGNTIAQVRADIAGLSRT